MKPEITNSINSLHTTRPGRSQHKTEKSESPTQYLTTEPSRLISNVKYKIRKLTQDATLLAHSLSYCPKKQQILSLSCWTVTLKS